VVSLLGVLVGSTTLSIADVWAGLTNSDPLAASVVRGVRLPIVVLAGLVGALLAGSGAAVQGLLRNPLADPYLLGISGGAALGVALTVVLGIDTPPVVTGAAFVGSLGAVALIYGVAGAIPGGIRGARATTTLLLTGVVFNAMSGAGVLVMHALLAPEKSHSLLLWMMGSLGSGSGTTLAISAAVLGLGAAVLIPCAHQLNALALGEDQAAAIGVAPDRVRRTVFFTTSLMVGTAVAFSGLIGFVGLLVPHLVRLRWGGDYRLLLPASMLAGAAFLILADTGARAAFLVAESVLPVGSITALVGAPTFLLLLRAGLRDGR
jgi:iron complex transport system permease protein